ncbi:site-specific integrase [Parvicella tangerina]|uniref:Tyrosine recombinase XerC n=1 Tax=Parvicella tangerina TaxID=2829795 RepID=A0A916JN97_9FLAO|nr:site-specific integrase [Parvicella tangerina]CAG5083007.1 Tyrosine recombinase XerC [Parvicella tangerina]
MKKTNFYLKDKKTDSETTIMLCKRIRGKMFKYSTGIKVNPNHWDNDEKKVLKARKNYSRINQVLNKIQVHFDEAVYNYLADDSMSFVDIKEILDEKLDIERNRKNSNETLAFEDIWCVKWIDSLKVVRSEGTWRKKGYVLNSLIDFTKDTKFKLEFENIDMTFAENYKRWALNVKDAKGRNRYTKDNSIHKNIEIIKGFCRWAYERGYTKSNAFEQIKGFDQKYFAPFALSSRDLTTLMDIDFSLVDLNEYNIRPCNHARVKEALEKTRDAFVFRCLCGIRHGDYYQLDPSKIINNKLQLVTEKTKSVIYLSLHPYASSIILKYDYKVPKLMNQNENENLKLMAQISGFNEIIEIVYMQGAELVREDKYRWELVTTHTARKTFITNCLRAGIPPHIVMEIVGIKKASTLQRYINISKADIEESMEKLNNYLGSKSA